MQPHLLRREELAAVTDRFACWRGRFKLLDDFGVRRVVMDARRQSQRRDTIVSASDHYYPIVKAACGVLRPSCIYERLCLGNYVAADLSRELQIPYRRVNGSGLSMQRSFRHTGRCTDVYLKAEGGFRQATLIW